jgi:hypothetical protein
MQLIKHHLNNLFFLLVILLLVIATTTEGCMCISQSDQYTLQKSYHSKSLMHVKVVGKAKTGRKKKYYEFYKNLYIAEVLLDYKGQVSQGQYIVIRSDDESLCGKNLTRGPWVVSLSLSNSNAVDEGGVGVYQIFLCDFNRKYKDLTKDQLEFLNSRMICDKEGSCVCGDGSNLNQCFIDPCEVSTCENYPEAKCEENYCGDGCNAEFKDDLGIHIDCQA